MSDTPQIINWPEAADSLCKRFGENAFEPSTLVHLRQAGNVVVACSGGADSVFILCVLVAHAEALGFQLHVAHYNHRWRGEDADADAAFVESLASAFNLQFLTEARPDNEAAFTETTARALRLDFLRKAAGTCDCDYIVFCHQLDDIVETQLQRIARGCGAEGLAAPRPVACFDGLPTHLRPLLHLRAGDIRMALNATSIPWREDQSNDDVSIARNALRKQIIPDLAEALGRDPSTGAARSRRLLEEDAAALNTLARQSLPDAYAHTSTLDRAALRAAPTALLRRALAEWLSGHELIDSVGAPAMDILIKTLCSTREQYRMSAGSHYILINAETLSWEHRDGFPTQQALQPSTVRLGEPVFLSTGALITAEMVDLTDDLRRKIQSGSIDPQTEAIIEYRDQPSFEVRAWQPGDRFQPLGAPGRKKLKDWFIDRHIPQEERKTLPLVINASEEVVWVPGFAPAESCKICPATKTALRLTYQTSNPL
jgi:tRNA(Ile)-lysidine synthase